MDRSTTQVQRTNSHSSFIRLVLYVVMIAGGAILIFPIAWMVITALKGSVSLAAYPPKLFPWPVMWRNFIDGLKVLPFATFYKNSLIITISCMIGDVLTSALVAFGFSRFKFYGREILFILVLSTMLLPLQVTIVPRFILFRKFGWIDNFWPIIVPAFLGGSGFYIFLLRQFFLGIPNEIADAARIDGCGPFGIFWRIYLPLSKPALATIAIFSFMYNWNDFFVPLVFLNSKEKYTVQLGLNLFMDQYNVNWSYLMANAILATLPCFIIFFFAQRFFIQGITMTGVKE